MRPRGNLPAPRPPERTYAEIKKNHHNPDGNQKRSVFGPVSPTSPHAPKVRGKHNYRQQEEHPGDFKPQDAAHAPERTKKSAQTASDASAGLNGFSGRLSRLLAQYSRVHSRLGLRRDLLLGLRWCLCDGGLCRGRQPFAGHLSGDAQPRAQHPANDLCSHSVYDGSSDAG